MADHFLIRPVQAADAARIAELERQCFSDPWSRQGIEEVIGLPIGFGLVAEEAGVVIAYLLARWVGDTAEVLNLAVLPEHRRRGIAAALLGQALSELRRLGVADVYLEVRESNQAARALYGAHGFRVAGMRPAYYRQPTEDALVLRCAISGAA